MTLRRLLHFDIASRQASPRGMVASDDFRLLARDLPCPFPQRALAYCMDLRADRVLFTTHGDDIAGLFDAPFLYTPQLLAARHVVSVPFERLAEFDEPGEPGLIFSPGRAGSTLFARLLTACGARCASEPDMLTQVCCLPRDVRIRLGLDMEISLLRGCLASLCRVLGPAPFVKLRSQCNARALPLLKAAGGHAYLLLRRQHDWALSRHLAFGEPPASIAGTLREWVDAVDKLVCQPAPPTVLWYEDMRRDPVAVVRTCLTGLALPEAAIAAVMRADSQAGTAIARDAVATRQAVPDFASAFDQAWSRASAGAEWSQQTLGLLDRMQNAPAV